MAYTTHPGIVSGELIKAQDIHEMDEQIYKNSLDLTQKSAEIASLQALSLSVVNGEVCQTYTEVE